mmetsp:Transcript_29996/g.78685  ORF Transcript_29996/g.78685 Transcript_29996/m.78685 type:complete len:205 (-) Transcript_29996:1080-1694(-)
MPWSLVLPRLGARPSPPRAPRQWPGPLPWAHRQRTLRSAPRHLHRRHRHRRGRLQAPYRRRRRRQHHLEQDSLRHPRLHRCPGGLAFRRRRHRCRPGWAAHHHRQCRPGWADRRCLPGSDHRRLPDLLVSEHLHYPLEWHQSQSTPLRRKCSRFGGKRFSQGKFRAPCGRAWTSLTWGTLSILASSKSYSTRPARRRRRVPARR